MKTTAVISRLMLGSLCYCALPTASAEPWTGEGEFGFVHVSGNTESETLRLGFKLEKTHNNWEHTSRSSAVRTQSDGNIDAESYSVNWRTEYLFSERTYGFGDARYFEDKFDSFDEIYSVAFGIGHKVIDRETLEWDISAGLGYRVTSTEPRIENAVIVPAEEINGVTYLLESDYKHDLSDTTRFENYTRVEINSDNTFSQNVTSLAVKINASLALKVAYDIRHNSDPQPGFKNSDRISSVNIVYSF